MTSTDYTPPKSRAPQQASRPASSRPKRLSANRQRNLVAQTIERLLDLLDAIEPDADLEPNGDDEPSLGWPTSHEIFSQTTLNGYDTGDDREGHSGLGLTEDDEPDVDGEPSLGSLDRMVNQNRWAEGGGWGTDVEHDDADKEPNLGSLNSCGQSVSQEQWAKSNRDDREDEHDGAEPWGLGIHGAGSNGSGL